MPIGLRHPIFSAVLLVVASVTLTLIAAEIGLRLFLPQLFEVHPRGMYIVDEAVGYVLTPSFNGVLKRPEFRHSTETNSVGLRGREPRPRQPHTFRIVCLGDSMTWGFGVPASDTYAAQLERTLAVKYPGLDIQVLNAGVAGYGTADELHFLESRAALLDPDLVILQFLPDNDFVENRKPAKDSRDVQNGWMVTKAGARDAERDARRVWPAWIRALDGAKHRSHLVSFVSERVGYLAMRSGLGPQRALTRAYDFDEEDATRAIDLMRKVALTADARGASTIFVLSPSQTPVLSGAASDLSSVSAIVAKAASEAGAGFIDLTGPLIARPDRIKLYYPINGHWTAAGHAAVAEILSAYIGEHILKGVR
jgi:lysophospholipase L1-like esterase